MATRFELVLQGDSEPHLRAAGEEALAEIQLWHQRLSWFEPSSFLSHLNRHGADRPVKCDGEVFELLTLCKSLARQTRHHFNPALGAMMVAAGFRGSPRNESALTAARGVSSMKFVILNPADQTVSFTRPGLSLDLGAIAKGWALDKALTILRAARIPRGIMHGGTSSVVAWDDGPDRTRQNLPKPPQSTDSAAHPSNSNASIPPTVPAPPPGHQIQLGPGPNASIITLHNAALGISAQHGRMIDGRGHVLSVSTPNSPPPIAPVQSVAVLVPLGLRALGTRHAAASADAWSTAILAAGGNRETGSAPLRLPRGARQYLDGVALTRPIKGRWC